MRTEPPFELEYSARDARADAFILPDLVERFGKRMDVCDARSWIIAKGLLVWAWMPEGKTVSN